MERGGRGTGCRVSRATLSSHHQRERYDAPREGDGERQRSRLDEPLQAPQERPTRRARRSARGSRRQLLFSREVATQSSQEWLLEPLARIPDAPTPAEPREELDDPSRSEFPAAMVAVAEPAESPATMAPPSSPVVELPPNAPRAAAKGARDPMFVVAVLAIVVGIAGVTALLALFLW